MIRSTSHIFLDLPQLSAELQAYIDNTSQQGNWSNNCVQVSQSVTHARLPCLPILRVGMHRPASTHMFAKISCLSCTAVSP